jgi:hypothetical protein
MEMTTSRASLFELTSSPPKHQSIGYHLSKLEYSVGLSKTIFIDSSVLSDRGQLQSKLRSDQARQ